MTPYFEALLYLLPILIAGGGVLYFLHQKNKDIFEMPEMKYAWSKTVFTFVDLNNIRSTITARSLKFEQHVLELLEDSGHEGYIIVEFSSGKRCDIDLDYIKYIDIKPIYELQEVAK